MADSRVRKYSRIRLNIIAVFLVILCINLGGFAVYWKASKYSAEIENSLTKDMVNILSVLALQLSPADLDIIKIAADDHVLARMSSILRGYKVKNKLNRLYIIDIEKNVIADGDNMPERPQKYLDYYIDSSEIKKAGQGGTGITLMYSVNGVPYKSVYYPVRGREGTVKYILCAEASSSFLQWILDFENDIFRIIILIGLISVIVAGIFIVFVKKVIDYIVSLEEELTRNEKLALAGQLSAGVAHEIRNPLSIVSGCAEMIKATVLNNALIRETADDILEEVERMNSVVQEFLDFANPRSLQVEKKDINGIIEDLLSSVSGNPHLKNIKMIRKLDKTIGLISIDELRIRQVLLNLILNGIQALEQGGALTLSTAREKVHFGKFLGRKEGIIIRVADNGPGIPAENLERIFEPFFSTKKNGIGLGLAIVKNIVEEHKGFIKVQCFRDNGTEFAVYLPEV